LEFFHPKEWEPSYRHDKVTSRGRTVRLMNVAQCHVAADLLTRSVDLNCESACKLLSSAFSQSINQSIYIAP